MYDRFSDLLIGKKNTWLYKLYYISSVKERGCNSKFTLDKNLDNLIRLD